MDTTNWNDLKWIYLEDTSYLEVGVDKQGLPKVIRYGKNYPIPTTETILNRARIVLQRSITFAPFVECYYRSGWYRAAKIINSLTVK